MGQNCDLPGPGGKSVASHYRIAARRVPSRVLITSKAQNRALLIRGIVDQAVERHEEQCSWIELGISQHDHPGRGRRRRTFGQRLAERTRDDDHGNPDIHVRIAHGDSYHGTAAGISALTLWDPRRRKLTLVGAS